VKPPQVPVCKEPETFPEVIKNRPGLDRIRYRVGDYASARAWLFERLDQQPKLATWTYRGADDPGIALLEGAALLIDSLTFYQEAYANEAFLRTATWRESVAELVRLLGYRLKPGLGGTGTFALEVSGPKPVTITKGHAMRATLAPDPQQVTFQTEREVTALPWLSKLTLTRPQLPLGIPAGTTKLVVDPGTPQTFAKNDRLAIGVLNGGTALYPFEIVVVDKVETWHGRSVLTLKGAITKIESKPLSLTAIKLDRTFHISGHTAPEHYVTVDANGIPHGCAVDFTVQFPTKRLVLEPQVPDLALGTKLAVQIPQSTENPFISIATVVDVMAKTVASGPMSIPSTVVTVAETLGSPPDRDRRLLLVDTVIGAPFKVGPTWTAIDVAPNALFWWGDTAHAKDLKGRRVAVAPTGKPSYEMNVVDVTPVPAVGLSLVTLDRKVDYADFGDGNTTPVFGNLVDVTQGKSEQHEVLGNGDDRATFQSFQIPKGPLTYLERAALTPPERPEIDVIVAGRIWTYVPVLFGQPPDAEVYIVRQDDEGNSWVQFGDGKTAARLPSGVDNVSVRWRTGSGAYGALADGTTPSVDRAPHLETVALVGVVAGGSEPEVTSMAKVAAPARVQSLDRIVSITDVRTEALAIGGVAHATAVWTVANGLPVIQVALLMQAGRTAELQTARQVLATANRMRGPQRFPIVVVAGAFEYVHLDVTLAIDPSYDPQPVRDAVAKALDDLLGEQSSRTFGDAEYATRIEGIAQNVAGVQWALVNGFSSLGVADDPAMLVPPAVITRAEILPCAATHVLRLAPMCLALHTVRGNA
jgi:hypothetical protein